MSWLSTKKIDINKCMKNNIIDISLSCPSGAGGNFLVSEYDKQSSRLQGNNEYLGLHLTNSVDNEFTNDYRHNGKPDSRYFEHMEFSNNLILFGHRSPVYFLRTFDEVNINCHVSILNNNTASFHTTLLIIKNFLSADYSESKNSFKLYDMMRTFYNDIVRAYATSGNFPEISIINPRVQHMVENYPLNNISTATPLFIKYLTVRLIANEPVDDINDFKKWVGHTLISAAPLQPDFPKEMVDSRINNNIEVEYDRVFFDLDFPQCKFFDNISKLKIAKYSYENIKLATDFINQYTTGTHKLLMLTMLNQFEKRLDTATVYL